MRRSCGALDTEGPDLLRMRKLLALFIVGVIAWRGYVSYSHRQQVQPVGADTGVPRPMRLLSDNVAASASFSCDGRTSCSQMTSCAEATYFLNHCPGVKMDGDSDGIPCEKQWCSVQ